MTSYLFDVKTWATVRVEAADEAAAREKLEAVIADIEALSASQPDGTTITIGAEDNAETAELVES